MKRNIMSVLVMLLAVLSLLAQDTGRFMAEVTSNHPVIKHYESILEARRAESVTGNTPGAFSAGFGYFPGTPDAIGVKRTFSASQAFEFPTTYILRGKLNREAFALAEAELAMGKVEALLEAKLLAYKYIAIRKRIGLLQHKLHGYDSLMQGWSTLFEEGAVTLPDYNRLTLELAGAASAMASEEAAMMSVRSRLDYISGGGSDLLNGAGYDQEAEQELNQLIEVKKKQHPAFMLGELEYSLALGEVELSRAGNLPGIEIGFGSEIIAGEHHTGPTAGISIPVWTNRNQVRLAKAKVVAAGAGREASLGLLVSEATADYELCKNARNNYENMREKIGRAGSVAGLTEALREKEITLSDYFAYMDTLYDSGEIMISLEYEYYSALARLYDHSLIIK
jgi:outer membrane protein, heavy metal efflux system